MPTSAWICPSVTPKSSVSSNSDSNSAWRMVRSWHRRLQHLRLIHFYTDVAKFSELDVQKNGPVWELEYSARDAYGTAIHCRKTHRWTLLLHEVTEAMSTNRTLVQCLICTSRRALVRLSRLQHGEVCEEQDLQNSQWKCCIGTGMSVKFNLSLLWSMNGRWLSPDKVGTISVTLYFPKTNGPTLHNSVASSYNVAATVAATGANQCGYNCSCNIENLALIESQTSYIIEMASQSTLSFASRDELESPDYSVPPFISAPPKIFWNSRRWSWSIIPLIGKKVRKYFGFSNLVTNISH